MALAQLQLLVKVQQEKEDKMQAQYIAAQQNYQSMQQKYQGLADYRIEYVQQTQSRGQQGMASRYLRVAKMAEADSGCCDGQLLIQFSER